eukprot:6919238-Heterocapsa_arctica.AAC.1
MPPADSVEYARLVFPLNDDDWIDPESGLFLAGMTLDQLVKIRRVKTLDCPVLTILPWARHLNESRCTYCSKRDHHDVRRLTSHCLFCSSPLIRAQDELRIYDEAVDNLVRGIGKEGTGLFEDEPAGAFICERSKQ